MGSSTKVIPTTQQTTQTVQLPDYLQDAGKAAVGKANQIASTPFPKYNGELVAGLSDNQNAAVGKAAQDSTAGQGSLGVAQGALGGAGTVAANSVGSGSGALNGAATLFGTQGADALNSRTAGMASGDLDAQLAGLAGTSATGNQNAGAGDLTTARDYNSKSAAPISATDLQSYFNPYVQMALDPQIAALQKQAGITQAGLQSKAAMSGAFGGSRSAIQESQNNSNLLQEVGAATGKGYSDAYTQALAAAQAQQGAYSRAANTAVSTSGQANTNANSALDRLTQAATSAGSAGTTQSQLATDAQGRLSSAGNNAINLGTAQSNLSTADVNRLLSLVAPANQTATEESQLSNDALNRLLTTGNLVQTQNQNVDNANYQQYENENVNWPQQQLNALIAAAGGTPYGTTTNATTNGQTIVQSPSILGQLAGAGAAVAGTFAGSSRDSKENFDDVEDEDILARFRRIPVSTYDYKPEAQALLHDDGSRKIGPMADDWAREFGGSPNVIPMPTLMGAMVSAIRALDKRTADEADNDAEDDILSEFKRMAA